MISIQLKYKGSRTYLHGSDIYNAIVQELLSRLDGRLQKLVFKRFSRNQIELLLEMPENPENLIGNGVWVTPDGEKCRFWIRETDELVTESYPFDEDSIIDVAQLSGECVQSDHANQYSVIENIIALTKKLNYVLSPDVSGKWLFGQIDLKQRLPMEWSSIKIERTSCVGSSYSRNRIIIDRADYGDICFIGG